MKNLLVLTICLSFLSVLCVQAQEKSKKAEVPAIARSAFDAKYPKAEKISWSVEKPGEFEAEFVLNSVECSAVFDTNGKFIESETEIKESELPQAIRTVIAKDFAGFKLDDIAKATDASGVTTFEMEASKSKEKYEISFDINGKLLNKEKEENKEK